MTLLFSYLLAELIGRRTQMDKNTKESLFIGGALIVMGVGVVVGTLTVGPIITFSGAASIASSLFGLIKSK